MRTCPLVSVTSDFDPIRTLVLDGLGHRPGIEFRLQRAGGSVAEQRVQRRLAAILAADVVGYTRLMEADEAGTLARLKAGPEPVI